MVAKTAIYLDYNASAPMRAGVVDAVRALLAEPGNASSVHGPGRAARARIESARVAVGRLAGMPAQHVTFTSGATEANVTALSPDWKVGGAARRFTRLLVGATEHPSVTSGGRFPAEAIETIPVDPSGLVDVDALARRLAYLQEDGEFPLVSVMAANNETGVLQPLERVGEVVADSDCLLHVDAVQAAGRVPLDMTAWGAASMALSAHKIGGPQGAGALVLRDEQTGPRPLLRGGGQEGWRRAGTENTLAIAGFGVAAGAALGELDACDEITRLRDGLERGLCHIWNDTIRFGTDAPRLPNTCCFAVPGVAAETALIALDMEGIAVSSGSACSSGKVSASPVLLAMGVPRDLARCAIRISLGPETSAAEIETFLAAWQRISRRIREASAGRAA